MSIFKIFGKGNEKVNFPIGELMKTDMHSHILPGIDDGATDVEMSIQLMQGMYDAGIRKFVATPHVMADIHRNTPQSIQVAYDELKVALQAHPHLQDVRYAAEFMLDEQYEDKLKAKEILNVFGDHVLVETPILNRPFNIESLIFITETEGFTPILAHPERYMYLFRKPEEYKKLKDRGCLFQLNVLSLTGYYGKMEKEAAVWLIEQNMIDFLGSDMHHKRHLMNFHKYNIDRKVAKILEKSNFMNHRI